MKKWTRLLVFIIVLLGIGNISIARATELSTTFSGEGVTVSSEQVTNDLTSKTNEENNLKYGTGGVETGVEVKLTDTSNIPEYVPSEASKLVRSSGVSAYNSDYGRVALGNLTNGSNMQLAYDAIVVYLDKVHNGSVAIDSNLNSGYYCLEKMDISSYKINSTELSKVFDCIRNDYPEFFWLSNTYTGTYNPSTNCIIDFIPFVSENFTTKQLRSTMKDKVQNAINEYISSVSDLTSDYDIEKQFHDKMIEDTIYDPNLDKSNENINNHNITGVLVDHVAVCESYAKTMQLLLNAANIDNVYVVGNGNGGPHAWNQVKLDDSYYNLDVTWDDLGSTDFDGIRYEYFNATDEYFNGTDTITSSRHEANSPDESTGTGEYLYPIQKCSSSTYSYYNQNPEIIAIQINISDNASMKEFLVLRLKSALENNTSEIRIAGETSEITKTLYTYLKSNISEIVNDARISSMFWAKYKKYGCNIISNGQRELRITLIPESKVLLDSIDIPKTLNFDTLIEAYYLNPVISPENATNKEVTWKTSNSSVATIVNGVVTAISEGIATITCTANDGSGKSATCSVKVDKTPEQLLVSSVTVLPTTATLTSIGQTLKLSATVTPNDAGNQTLTWTSNNEQVATVSADGEVTAVADGTATITCTTNDGSRKSATCVVTVDLPVKVTSITLNKTSFDLAIEQTETLVATLLPGDASNKEVTWESNNTAVITVDLNGKVTAVGAGSATIICTAKDGSGKSVSCNVKVTNPVVKVTSLSLSKTSLSMLKGNAQTLAVTILPSNATNKGVTWSSGNTTVATVDIYGKVTAVGVGTTTIKCTSKDGSAKYATCTVTVTPVKVTLLTLNKGSLSVIKGYSSTLTASILPNNATNKGVTWKSSNTAVATVDPYGKVTGIGVGNAVITCRTKDVSNKSATCKVTVTNPISVTKVTLNKSTLSLKVGKTSILTAAVATSNATNKTVTWTSSNTKIATVDSNGKVTAKGPGTVTITCTTKDGSNKTAKCIVMVTK